MHYQRFKTFKQVYENLSFKKAAEVLIMTQSAVSQQIAALEETYGTIFFLRKGRHIEPTAEGKALYDWVLPVIEAVEEFPDRFRALQNLEHGKLRIGSTEEASLAIAPFLSRFSAAYPLIEVSLSIGVEKELKAGALNDLFEFAVVDEVPDLRRDPSFNYQIWGENAFRLITPPTMAPVKKSSNFALEKETFLLHSTDISLRAFISRFFPSEGVSPAGSLRSVMSGPSKRWFRKGRGFPF